MRKKILFTRLITISVLVSLGFIIFCFVERCSNRNAVVYYKTRSSFMPSNCENSTIFYLLWNGYSNKKGIFHGLLFEKKLQLDKNNQQILKNILIDANTYQEGELSTCEIDGCIVFYDNYGKIMSIIYLECSNWQISVNNKSETTKTMLFSEIGFNKLQSLLCDGPYVFSVSCPEID